ncbi:DegT/DnrJ/EryC1/StrS family aminotransferase [Flavobacterium franklandianum]|uniref:Pyridoxal phosphate-dependent aminotransferase n=1 Tax=Flavobacterium franklandianum TaxID=2594430 RepID=A0A553CKF7_9FLAO|nr:DegT/DnrJ/EryC1/StrS family aminotransferase [Flavobacterium franklandianum]TRX20989.1 pyridoxal phosphate-dependent aminotransferase [Flavobacterium franklandianum]
MGGNEQKFIKEAFDTNWVAPMGTNVDLFEMDLKTYLSNNVHVTALSSGTAAIHLGLILLGIKAGDEVICQSLTFTATANPILYLKAIPVFIDSEIETWNLCPIALEEAIIDRIKLGNKPKAIITVHLYGNPYKIEEIRAVADKYQIPILEDAAEALGSSYKGQKCGVFGDLCVLSFNGNKIITTSGGGALVSHSQNIKSRAIFLATQSKDKAIHYEHSEVGYNYRLSNISASIGRGQMEKLDEFVNLRRKMQNFYKQLFENVKGVSVFEVPNEDYFSNHWLSVITINPSETNGIDCDDLRLALESENIESRFLWKPLHMQPLHKDFPYYGGNIAESLFAKGLCLPSGSNTTEEEKARIQNVIKCLFKNKIKKKIKVKSLFPKRQRLFEDNMLVNFFTKNRLETS